MRPRRPAVAPEDFECALTVRERTISDYRFAFLHDDGQLLIRDWVGRGLRLREDRGNFEGFIFLWIGINAWAACVTDTEVDAQMVARLACDAELNEAFLHACESADFRARVEGFLSLWPVFSAKEIERKGLDRWPDQASPREDVVASYIRGGARRFEPRCILWHTQRQEPVPSDWAHAIKAIYTIRCNLFHGGKTRSSEADTALVDGAYSVLSAFVEAVIGPRLGFAD
jgi:hypothetical protein